MPFQNLHHQAVDCAAQRRDLLQHRSAFRFRIQGLLQGGRLAANPADAQEQLLFVAYGMRNGRPLLLFSGIYTGVQYIKTQEAAMEKIGPTELPLHSHRFEEGNPLAERRTRQAAFLTALMMAVEIACGYLFNSMALLADGWHMSSHTLALGLSVLAYVLARRFASDARFAFGTWKVEVLGGYTSAILLLGVAALMLYQSAERVFSPSPIRFDQAIGIAVLGLAVNLACARLLHDGHTDHGHGHAHPRGEGHSHAHHDLNLRSAYIHVIADAATSVLAIIALLGGRFFGADWLDPIMGIVGAGLVSAWAIGLLRDSGRVLLDAEMKAPVVGEIREAVGSAPVRAVLQDLHVWRVGRNKYACILSVAAEEQVSPDFFRKALSIHEELVHVTVEINPALASA
jgi:cation diffusion facilitator family transporter